MNWIEQAIITLVTAVAAYIGGGWYQKRKAKAGAEKSELENLKDIIVTWREAYADLKQQREEYSQLWADLQAENTRMKIELQTLSEQVKVLQCDNAKLKKEIEKLKQ